MQQATDYIVDRNEIKDYIHSATNTMGGIIPSLTLFFLETKHDKTIPIYPIKLMEKWGMIRK